MWQRPHYPDLARVVPLVVRATIEILLQPISTHYPDLGSDTSSVWNFFSRLPGVILRGNQWWCGDVSAVSLGYSLQGCHLEAGAGYFQRKIKKKIGEPKETPSCLIPRLLVVVTRQLEILVTTLSKRERFSLALSSYLITSVANFIFNQ